jgi:anti-sigma regulatory factor (Ser/Thr protein kinase)
VEVRREPEVNGASIHLFTSPPDPLVLAVTEPSQVGDARRTATALAGALAFGQTRCGEVAIVATEVANNLVRHASSGELIIRSLRAEGCAGIEFLAIDKGPGIANVSQALRDGYSTGGTPGTGLGAVRRLSTEFDIYSWAGSGTALLSRMWAGEPPARSGGWDFGVVCLPKPGEEQCGDSWSISALAGRLSIVVADGLGHGPIAATASRQAVQTFRENLGAGPVSLMQSLHAALRSTRGAAVALVELKPGELLRFVGVGNIAASVINGGATRNMVSHNGTVGAEARRVQEFTYPWSDDSLLVMHSDGLATQWQMSSYPGLTNKHPALIAAVLYRDFRRIRDDVTVLIAKSHAGRLP